VISSQYSKDAKLTTTTTIFIFIHSKGSKQYKHSNLAEKVVRANTTKTTKDG